MLSFLLLKVNWFRSGRGGKPGQPPLERPALSVLADQAEQLPEFVRACPVAMKYLRLLGPLDWAHFPERGGGRAWPGSPPQPRAPYVAAYLVKLHEQKRYMSQLRAFLVEHPALVWVLGFKLEANATSPYGFAVEASVPSRKQLGRVLRTLPNEAAQFLLSSTVQLLKAELPVDCQFGQAVSLDTRLILAWVKENNPKAYVREHDRLTKDRQPKGDCDCKLGCKKRHNPSPDQEASQEPASPAQASPKKKLKRQTNFSPCDQYAWGYASGVVATKVADYGEFVLADFTQSFDRPDASFFFPLMTRTEQALGSKPKCGALDAAYDCWYVHDYFHDAGGFAAVPLVERGLKNPQFDPAGLPLCQAGLAMPCHSTYLNRRGLVPQQMGHYGCPLLYPEPTGQSCPIAHKNWPKGGCDLTMGVSIGARLRYQLDRESESYKQLYNQRTATERVNALATDLGLARPKLRHQRAIANQATLTYVLLNLRALHRLRDQKKKNKMEQVSQAAPKP